MTVCVRGVPQLADKDAAVRQAALQLLDAMLRHGVIMPILNIEPYVAMLTDAHAVIRKQAIRSLVDLQERHPCAFPCLHRSAARTRIRLTLRLHAQRTRMGQLWRRPSWDPLASVSGTSARQPCSSGARLPQWAARQ